MGAKKGTMPEHMKRRFPASKLAAEHRPAGYTNMHVVANTRGIRNRKQELRERDMQEEVKYYPQTSLLDYWFMVHGSTVEYIYGNENPSHTGAAKAELLAASLKPYVVTSPIRGVFKFHEITVDAKQLMAYYAPSAFYVMTDLGEMILPGRTTVVWK